MAKRDSQDAVKNKALKLLEEAEARRASIRFERGLHDFENNRLEILNNSEFREKLGEFIFTKYTQGKLDKAEPYIDILFELICQEKFTANIQKVLIEIWQRSLRGSNIRLIKFLCYQYTSLQEEREVKTFVNEELADFLVKAAALLVRSSLWQDFSVLLELLIKIKNITVTDGDEVRSPYVEIFTDLSSKVVLEQVFLIHKIGDTKQRKLAIKTMDCFGEDALLYLMNRLVFSPAKDERYKLMELIRELDGDISPIIHKFMEEDLPWYAVRNLVLLLSGIGDPDHYPMVEGYLVHQDERVQQQVVNCIVKMGGKNFPKRLIQALPVVCDEIKLKLVMQFGSYDYEEIADAMLDLLHNRSDLSEDIRDEIIYRLCVSLRAYPYRRVTNVLKRIHKECAEEKTLNRKITIAIEETINVLEPKIRHRVKGEQAEIEGIGLDFNQSANGQSGENVEEFIQKIDEMVQNGELEKASALMYKKIIDSARSKDFITAELLRDKLLEANPESLQDVIRAAEIIEEEKSLPSIGLKIDLWDDLFQKLSTDEYKSLMNCFRNENYKESEKIVGIGEIDPSLYFFSSGSARISCQCGSQETFLKRVIPGDVIGTDSFFSASVWTIGLVALKRTQVQVIKRNDFSEICKEHPDFEEKLKDYLKKKESVEELVRMSGRDRRDFARYPVNVTVNNILLDPYGGSEGRRNFQGEMLDISKGGLSFTIRISNRESAELLLGRQIISEIHLKGNEVLKCFGLIVGVRFQHELVKEYSIHVKFYKELEQRKITDVLNLVI